MKTEEDEAFDELAKRQGAWGGGYQAKRQMAADKFIAAEEQKVGERYGYVPKLHPSEWMGEPAQECPNLKNCEGACFQCEYFNAETGKTEYPAPQPAHCQCTACKDGILHASDCAVHNGPAYPAGPCDCGVLQEPVAYVTGIYGGRFTYEPINPAMILPVGMALYAAPIKEKNG